MALAITRRYGEAVIINDTLRITAAKFSNGHNQVKLVFEELDPNTKNIVYREEIYGTVKKNYGSGRESDNNGETAGRELAYGKSQQEPSHGEERSPQETGEALKTWPAQLDDRTKLPKHLQDRTDRSLKQRLLNGPHDLPACMQQRCVQVPLVDPYHVEVTLKDPNVFKKLPEVIKVRKDKKK